MFSLSHFDFSKEEALEERLNSLWGKEVFEPGLSRVKAFIESFSFSSLPKIITVAGTNGKGETSRAITRLLELENKKCALWTSPHLVSITERFYAGGKLISYEELSNIITKVEAFQIEKNIRLSYYELLFCVFLLWTRDKKLDYLILEVGLGGRLDAVNALDADYALITSIARDHQEFLGKTYQKILKEKFGICRKKSILFTSFELSYLNQEVLKLTKLCECEWRNLKYDKKRSFSSHNRVFAQRVVSEILQKALLSKKINELDLHPVLGEKSISSKNFSFYGSHNPEALRKLVQFLSSSPYNQKSAYDLIVFSLSKRSFEDSLVVVKLISEIPSLRKVFVPMHHHKAQPLGEILSILQQNGIEIRAELSQDLLTGLATEAKILVTGSNYFIGEFYKSFCLGGE